MFLGYIRRFSVAFQATGVPRGLLFLIFCFCVEAGGYPSLEEDLLQYQRLGGG